MKKTLAGKYVVVMVGILLSAFIFLHTPIISYAYTQATGIISADAAKVRKEPNTGSDAVTGLLKGSTVTVTDEVTDSGGALWYQVSVDGSTGYVRSDLMIKSTTSTGTTGTTTTPPASTKPGTTTATPIAETKAYINTESARVREGASTAHEPAGSVSRNTAVTITGEAKASDGKKWYQIKFNNANGHEIIGFVRADLITTGEPPAATPTPVEPTPEENIPEEGVEGEEIEAVPEDVPETEPEPEPDQKPDYEMKFAANAEGVEEWWLYENLTGTRQTLAGLKAAAEAGEQGSVAEAKLLSTQKIVIIVLAVVVAILLIITFLLFKIKDAYEDDDEDDDEDEDEDDDEDEEDEDDEEDEEDDEDDEEEQLAKKKVFASFKQSKENEGKRAPNKATVSQMPVRETENELPQQTSKPTAKKAKNFLIDDDEFEFEFLNMDDRE